MAASTPIDPATLKSAQGSRGQRTGDGGAGAERPRAPRPGAPAAGRRGRRQPPPPQVVVIEHHEPRPRAAGGRSRAGLRPGRYRRGRTHRAAGRDIGHAHGERRSCRSSPGHRRPRPEPQAGAGVLGIRREAAAGRLGPAGSEPREKPSEKAQGRQDGGAGVRNSARQAAAIVFDSLLPDLAADLQRRRQQHRGADQQVARAHLLRPAAVGRSRSQLMSSGNGGTSASPLARRSS